MGEKERKILSINLRETLIFKHLKRPSYFEERPHLIHDGEASYDDGNEAKKLFASFCRYPDVSGN